MAYGDFWKVVTREDYKLIQEWINNHDYEDVNTASIDVAYHLFDEKYGEEIVLVEWVESEPKIDEDTGEEYYDEMDTYQYVNSDYEGNTIEYHIADNEKVRQTANDLAQNHWRFSNDLIPLDEDMTLEEYKEQLFDAGYLD